MKNIMEGYLIDMILCGVAYVIMVYFMVKLMKVKNIRLKGNDDDNDGGISYSNLPEIDLPPGVSLPDGGPVRKINQEETEEVLV